MVWPFLRYWHLGGPTGIILCKCKFYVDDLVERSLACFIFAKDPEPFAPVF